MKNNIDKLREEIKTLHRQIASEHSPHKRTLLTERLNLMLARLGDLERFSGVDNPKP